MTDRRIVSAPTSGQIIKLPDVPTPMGDMLDQLTTALGVERQVLASNEQIGEAWNRLPRLISRIPSELRDEKVVRACIAVATGLFDAAINYLWNAAIVELRQKVRRFGLPVVSQILDDRSFDEDKLLDLKDADLLELCLKLNLINDQDFFFLDQCRSTRNRFSVAHPAIGQIDEEKILNFLSRCQKHALSSTQNPKGVDTKQLLASLESSRFTPTQREEWEERIRATFDAQRELIFGMLHGIYCDPSSSEEERINALSLCSPFSKEFTPKAKSVLVDRHQDYKAKGKTKRLAASRQFFVRLNVANLLGELEVHNLVTSASKRLLQVHNGWDNFVNEPPFAESLENVVRGVAVPESAQAAFVEAVVTCGIGNPYGVSHTAMPRYHTMVRSFSPKEIEIMFTLAKKAGTVAGRLTTSRQCARQFGTLVGLLDESSVPTSMHSDYRKWRRMAE